MRRRHRRLLNLFAFMLLGIAVYLNMFRMDDGTTPVNKNFLVKTERKAPAQIISASKIPPKQQHKN
jgi:hypothetical protein